MNYYLYLFLCYITHPFRWLMPFWKQDYGNSSAYIGNLDFGIRLLFRNDYMHAFVLSQALHETGMCTSNLYRNYNNCFGMGKINGSKYQGSGVLNGAINEPAYSASYKSVYHSIYDYYDYCTKRFPSTINTYDNIPKEAFNSLSDANERYILYCCTKLKINGYYRSDTFGYYTAIRGIEATYKTNFWRIGVNVVYCFLVPSALIIFCRRNLFNK